MSGFREWSARKLANKEGFSGEDIWEAAWGIQQAKIDALMLEYCPNEMTKEQLLEWAKHQRLVPLEIALGRGERNG